MKHKLPLDDYGLDFEGWAFLLFHTTSPVHLFADTLNRLYDIQLSRIEDLFLAVTPWPFFLHDDPVRHLKYFLAERPAAAANAPWEPGDKLLAIKGENAVSVAKDIYADFTNTAAVDPADLLAKERADLIGELLAGFTMVTLLDLSADTDLRPSSSKQRQQVEQLCSDLLEYIETKHLDLSDDERIALAHIRVMSD